MFKIFSLARYISSFSFVWFQRYSVLKPHCTEHFWTFVEHIRHWHKIFKIKASRGLYHSWNGIQSFTINYWSCFNVKSKLSKFYDGYLKWDIIYDVHMQPTNVTSGRCSLRNETQLLVGLSSQSFGISFAKVFLWSHLLYSSQEVPVISSVC